MLFRILLGSVLLSLLVAGGIAAHHKGLWTALFSYAKNQLTGQGSVFSGVRFRVDLVDRFNYSRIANRQPLLKIDPELDEWVQSHFPDIVLDDVGKLSKDVQNAVPRYYRISVCTATGPSMKELMDEFQSFSAKLPPEMTHLGCAVRPSLGGLTHQALVVVGQRLHDFSPEALTRTKEEAFFSICLHCKHSHIVRLSRQQNSLGLECPSCRKTYAVVAADSKGQYRYVNEYLTGYAPPAVFSKDIARINELFTICSTVHGTCIYTRDPGAKKNSTDAWQTSLETQRLGQGDCEDSSIYLCDWLLARGFQARVVLGRFGDLGGHAWVVVKMNNVEYLLESTEDPPDLSDPPIISKVGSRYVPELMFDRFAIYVRSTPGQAWRHQSDEYFSSKNWTRIEPRALNPMDEPLMRNPTSTTTQLTLDPTKVGQATKRNAAAAPFLELEDIPIDAAIWTHPLPVGHHGH